MESIPSNVQRPSRYCGSEIRRPLLPWDDAKIRVLLAFPDVYEIGMSHLGILLLQEILNSAPGVLCERAFAPWPDLEKHLRENAIPFGSLESDRPARDFDVFGFSLCHELTYTNVLAMLDLSGIPLRRGERGERDPLILGGGVCTLNPAPLEPFFDAFLVGDGEEAILEIAERVRSRKERSGTREDLLRDLSGVPGVYVPGISARVSRRVLPDLAGSPLLSHPILPSMRIVHDRLSVEISRGCTRGCRFCQAGYAYRPVRERDPLILLRYLQDKAPGTGYDEVGLLSLSAADYGCVDRLISNAMETFSPERISVSLPSIRLDALSENTVRQIRKVRKTGFTLAPEAGTERLRKAVNKDMRDEELLRSADWIYGNGWQKLKLYFMVGLPGETAEDVAAIGRLAKRVASVARRHGKRNLVTVSLSVFIPKPHTPFQWERQVGKEEASARIAMVRSEVGRDRNIEVKHHSGDAGELEGIFSRGDARLAEVLLRAFRLGARFDAWTESFRPETWAQAFRESGIDPQSFLEARDPEAPLPWDRVDAGIDRGFLLSELGKSRSGETTPDCRIDACSECGVCAPGIGNVTYGPDRIAESPASSPDVRTAPPAGWRYVVRIRYSKEGPARHLSGLEIQSLWGRILRRAKLPVAYSQGFNPVPRLSFSPALPVGTGSLAEFVEAEFSLPVPAGEVEKIDPAVLPAGIRILSAAIVPPGSPRLSEFDLACTYRIDPLPGRSFPAGTDPERVARAAESLRNSSAFPVTVMREDGPREIDIAPLASNFLMKDGALFITIIHGTGKGVRPLDAAAGILGIPLPADRFAATKTTSDPVPRRKR